MTLWTLPPGFCAERRHPAWGVLPRYLVDHLHLAAAQANEILETKILADLRPRVERAWAYVPNPRPQNTSENRVVPRRCGLVVSYDSQPPVPQHLRGPLYPLPRRSDRPGAAPSGGRGRGEGEAFRCVSDVLNAWASDGGGQGPGGGVPSGNGFELSAHGLVPGQAEAAPSATYTEEENGSLKREWGGELKFLAAYRLSIYKDEDRDDGRRMARTMMVDQDRDTNM